MDVDEFRRLSRERWEGAATGWGARREQLQSAATPVSQWMVEQVRPQPGHTVLELAAGPGDTGFLAAELIAPGGRLITTDGAEAMLDVARGRAQELGIANVEFRAMEAEWIDLPAASVDAVLCRWGYMLLADPEAALRETRRVLKPGGRVALAVWDAVERNPWSTVSSEEMLARGLIEPPPPDAPGPFVLGDPDRVAELLEAAGFDDVLVEAVDFAFRMSDKDEFWNTMSELSPTAREVLGRLSPAEHYALREAVDARLEPYVVEGGALAVPARTLVAAASA
jgi:SAM-dependent methyltransferase